jgi:hypothetical protein
MYEQADRPMTLKVMSKEPKTCCTFSRPPSLGRLFFAIQKKEGKKKQRKKSHKIHSTL